MKKKTNKRIKAFTLIELLGVIALIAVIFLIATPIVVGLIDSAKEKSYTESLRFLVNATNNYIVSNNFEDIPKEGLDVTNESIKMNNKSFISGKVYRDKDDKLHLETVTDGEYCGSGTLTNIEVVKGGCYLLDKTDAIVAVNSGIVTSKSIQVLVSAEDPESGIKSYEYSIDGGKTYINSTNTYTFKDLETNKEYTIKVRVTNGNNLSIEKEIVLKTVEISTPTYAVDLSGWQQQKIVTITYPTGTDLVYSYSLNGGTSWTTATQNQKVTFTANGTILARVTDGTNTVSATPLTVTEVDSIDPVITKVDGNTTEWTINKTLVVTATDTPSGLHATPYSFDGGATWQASNSKTITANKTYVVKVRDKALNEVSQNVVVSKISVTAPTITLTKVDVSSYFVTLNATVVDNEMGYSKIEYSKDNGTTWVNGGTNNAYTFSGLTKNTSYSFKARVTSNNGKVTTSTTLVVSTSDITIPTYSVDKTGWQPQKIVTITYPMGTDLVYSYSLNGGTSWINATQNQKVTFTANGAILARVTDETNTVSASPLSVTEVDSIDPVITKVDGNTTEWTINKTLVVTGSDALSGLHATPYSFDGGATWQASNSYTATTNKTYVVKIRDKALNEISQNVVVSKISVTAPTITLTKGSVSSYFVTLNATVVDNEMGYSKIEYSKDNGSTWVNGGTNATYTFSGLTKNTSYSFKARVTSNNGKVTTSATVSATTTDITMPTYAVDKTGWQKSKVVTITYPTGTNLTYSYSLNGGTSWTTATQGQKVTFTANGTILARVTDGTNTVSASPLTVTEVDNTTPTCGNITGASTTWTGIDRTITVACSDNGECSQPSFSQTFSVTTTTSNITISDKAGNTASCPVNVYVDKTKYTITIKQSTGGTVSTNVASAIMGETINVTATPNPNYELTSLTWNGNSITSGASFTMPRGNVDIIVTWKTSETIIILGTSFQDNKLMDGFGTQPGVLYLNANAYGPGGWGGDEKQSSLGRTYSYIDLTDFSTLEYTVTGSRSGKWHQSYGSLFHGYLYLVSKTTGERILLAKVYDDANGLSQYTVSSSRNVSSLNGEYYFLLKLDSSNQNINLDDGSSPYVSASIAINRLVLK